MKKDLEYNLLKSNKRIVLKLELDLILNHLDYFVTLCVFPNYAFTLILIAANETYDYY